MNALIFTNKFLLIVKGILILGVYAVNKHK